MQFVYGVDLLRENEGEKRKEDVPNKIFTATVH